jgi:hypothetical protein
MVRHICERQLSCNNLQQEVMIPIVEKTQKFLSMIPEILECKHIVDQRLWSRKLILSL